MVFFVIALWPLMDEGNFRVWALVTGIILFLISFIYPSIYKPFNYIWFKFGLLLGKIVTPIVMGFLYFFTITPTALIMRTLKKRPLDLEFDDSLDSYWKYRDPPGPSSESMKNQF
ncbi:MAG: hypothetical protein CMM20_02810 [Rhodospirillaceae bacterium]|nr:hypothetical protein [Rhodospirillaceae bacterium]